MFPLRYNVESNSQYHGPNLSLRYPHAGKQIPLGMRGRPTEVVTQNRPWMQDRMKGGHGSLWSYLCLKGGDLLRARKYGILTPQIRARETRDSTSMFTSECSNRNTPLYESNLRARMPE